MKKATTPLLFAFAAVALALSSWWWLRGDDAVPLPIEPPAAPQAIASAVVTATPQPAGGPTIASANSPERTAAVDATAAAGKAEPTVSYDILLVDAETHQPVAEAEACWLDDAAGEKYRASLRSSGDDFDGDGERIARTFGSTARSDRDGRLRLALPRSGAMVVARAGDRYGVAHVGGNAPPPADGYRLLLARDESLSVRVLDAGGQPAARVRVGLAVHVEGYEPSVGSYNHLAHTDGQGLATFSHVQQYRTLAYGPAKGRSIAAFVVGIAIHGLAVPPLVVDATRPLPQQPLELRLPLTGALRIRFHLAGARLEALDSVRVHAGPAGDSAANNQAASAPVDGDGFAHLPWLPAGVTLFAAPLGADVSFVGDAEVPPLVVGACRTHEVDIAQTAVVLRGRLLDVNGAPMAGVGVRVDFQTDELGGSGGVQTNASGLFLHSMRRPKSKAPLALKKFELVPFERQDLRLSLPPRELQLGVNELGDLRFGDDPLVCGGRLDGYEAVGFGVQLQLEREEFQRRTGALAWRSLRDPRVGVGRDGRFAARGALPPGRYRLVVTTRDYLPVAPIEFRLGQDDLVVPMRTGARLAVRCLVPPSTDAHFLLLDLVGGPPRDVVPDAADSYFGPADNRRGHGQPRADGAIDYQWSAVEAGSYTLQVSLRGRSGVLHEVADVVMPPPAAGDPRLMALDLCGVVRTVEVRLLDVAGQPLSPDGYAFVQPQSSADLWSGCYLDEHTRTVLLPTGAQQLLVVNEGFRPTSQLVPAEVTRCDVRCERWPQVELSLAPGTVVPAGCELFVHPVRSQPSATQRYEAGSARGRSSSGGLDNLLQSTGEPARFRSGTERSSVPVGDEPVGLYVALRCGDRQQRLKLVAPAQIVAGAPVTITLDADELAAAAAALAKADKAK